MELDAFVGGEFLNDGSPPELLIDLGDLIVRAELLFDLLSEPDACTAFFPFAD